MRKEVENALEKFNHGFNCAQAVLSAFCEKYGLDTETALKLASGLGSGFRTGDVCGAVSGAVLAIGLKYGQKNLADTQAKQLCYTRTEEFIQEYRVRNGSICCRELLGCELATPEGKAKAQRENLFGTVCVEKVRSAMQLLEEMGY